MANPEHVALLRQGYALYGEWRNQHPDVIADFSGADLSQLNLSFCDLRNANLGDANLSRTDLSDVRFDGANLKGANLAFTTLSGAVLRGADLTGAKLTLADFSGVNLSGVDLSGLNLNRVNFSRSNLSEVSLKGASLIGANLTSANLLGADLSEAILEGTVLSNLKLSATKGLEVVNHLGPSSLGIDTIVKSQGGIPDVFLRGCGVPDIFIQYIDSLTQAPIQHYSCFISYSTKDQEFAQRLFNDLQANNVRCWFDKRNMQGGKEMEKQIDQAIRTHDKLLLILSPHSILSEWVKTEIAKAIKLQHEEKRQMLFPVRLIDFQTIQQWTYFDSDVGMDYAKEIRKYYIPDFSDWKVDHDNYQKEFDKLLCDLQAT